MLVVPFFCFAGADSTWFSFVFLELLEFLCPVGLEIGILSPDCVAEMLVDAAVPRTITLFSLVVDIISFS